MGRPGLLSGQHGIGTCRRAHACVHTHRALHTRTENELEGPDQLQPGVMTAAAGGSAGGLRAQSRHSSPS